MFKYLTVLFFILTTLMADNTKALNAFKSKDYDKAFKLYEKNA